MNQTKFVMLIAVWWFILGWGPHSIKSIVKLELSIDPRIQTPKVIESHEVTSFISRSCEAQSLATFMAKPLAILHAWAA